jgi:hypothetical protein
MLETSQGVNPIFIGPGAQHKKKLESLMLCSSFLHCKISNGNERGPCDRHRWNTMASIFIDATTYVVTYISRTMYSRCRLSLKSNIFLHVKLHMTYLAANLMVLERVALLIANLRRNSTLAIEDIKKHWPPLHASAASFLDYFLAGPANTIKDSM